MNKIELNTDIYQSIRWAIDTITDKQMFGMDALSAARSRERRARGVLRDCMRELRKRDNLINDLRGELEKEKKMIPTKTPQILLNTNTDHHKSVDDYQETLRQKLHELGLILRDINKRMDYLMKDIQKINMSNK